MARIIRNGSSEKARLGSSGVRIIFLSRSYKPLKGSSSLPKFLVQLKCQGVYGKISSVLIVLQITVFTMVFDCLLCTILYVLQQTPDPDFLI